MFKKKQNTQKGRVLAALRINYKAIPFKTLFFLAQKQKYRSIEETENSRNRI